MKMNEVSIGNDLANLIAEYLERGLQICLSHRDYCGMGLQHRDRSFLYCPVIDGELMSSQAHWRARSADEQGPAEQVAFVSRDHFVIWLAKQTNDSLHGDGNQRITRERLMKAVRFCEKHADTD